MVSKAAKTWLAISRIKGVGPAKLARIAASTSDPVDLLARLPSLLSRLALPALTPEDLDWDWVEEEIARSRERGINILCRMDGGFPQLLRELPRGPSLLYLAGHYQRPDKRAVAIVGTRGATGAGRRWAHDLAAAVARDRWTVVSGLARGIDLAAHEGALAAGGRTLAVMGAGLGMPPPEKAELSRRIKLSGCLLSESFLDAPAKPWILARRNRWMAALSKVVILVEAPWNSGAQRTADQALGLGRPVLVATDPALAPSLTDHAALLKKGARAISNIGEALRILDMKPKPPPRIDCLRLPEMDDEAKRVWSLLSTSPLTMDLLAVKSGLPVAFLRSLLVRWLLEGLILQLPGERYVRVVGASFFRSGGRNGQIT